MSMHEALINVQSALKAPKNQTNTFGKYNYRSCEDILEAVKPLLKANGLTLQLSDELACVGNRVYIKATATLSDGTETRVSTALARESETKKGMDDSQVTGTASSYARKYALNGLFCIDDTKDADTNAYAKQTIPTQPEQENDLNQAPGNATQQGQNIPVTLMCSRCKKTIAPTKTRTAQQVADSTKERYGKMLCSACANQEQRELDAIAAEAMHGDAGDRS